MKNKNMKKAFTLVELVIVMVILGMLAAFAIPKMTNSKDGAIFASMKSDARTATQKAQMTFAERGSVSTFGINCGGVTMTGSNACVSTIIDDMNYTISITDGTGVCTNAVTFNSSTNGGVVATTCK